MYQTLNVIVLTFAKVSRGLRSVNLFLLRLLTCSTTREKWDMAFSPSLAWRLSRTSCRGKRWVSALHIISWCWVKFECNIWWTSWKSWQGRVRLSNNVVTLRWSVEFGTPLYIIITNITWTVVEESYLKDLVCPFSRKTLSTFGMRGTTESEPLTDGWKEVNVAKFIDKFPCLIYWLMIDIYV